MMFPPQSSFLFFLLWQSCCLHVLFIVSMVETNTSTPVAAAAVVATATILFYYKDKLQYMVKSHKERWELKKIVAKKENEVEGACENQPHVSGIFIHPGEVMLYVVLLFALSSITW